MVLWFYKAITLKFFTEMQHFIATGSNKTVPNWCSLADATTATMLARTEFKNEAHNLLNSENY